MADVSTESLKVTDSSKSITHSIHTTKMTVEKVTKQGNPAANPNATSGSSSSSTPTATTTNTSEVSANSPTQLKPAAETSAPVSPKKPESKNGSPVNKGLSVGAQQVPPKNSPKKNPWNMNPPSQSSSSSANSVGGGPGGAKATETNKKTPSTGTSSNKSGHNWTSSSRNDMPVSSKSIRIPKNEVPMLLLPFACNISMC